MFSVIPLSLFLKIYLKNTNTIIKIVFSILILNTNLIQKWKMEIQIRKKILNFSQIDFS